MDIVNVTRVRPLSGIGHAIEWMIPGQSSKIFSSPPVGVRIRGIPRYRWRLCVWQYIYKGRITNWTLLGIGKNDSRPMR